VARRTTRVYGIAAAQASLRRLLHTTSTSLAVSTAVSFASFTQLVLVKTGLPQLGARVSANRPLASLPKSPTISFPPLT
jgi:hypothetical protein